MPNLVEITIKADDETADGFASVLAKYYALKNAMRGGILIDVGTEGDITSSLIKIKQRVQAIGLADIADVNVQPGILWTRINLIKRMMDQAGIGGGLVGAVGASGKDSGLGGTAAGAAAGAAAGRGGGGGGFGGGLLGGLGGASFPLFGGLLGTIGGFHLLADAILEVVATLGPAIIAFGAFGAAAVPTVQAIYHQMQNALTVSEAFGTSIYPLSGGFSKIADAVKPEVLQLFGEGLVLINAKTGIFSQLATGAGKVLDDLGARFVYALTTGNGFHNFLGKAVQDLAGWGTLIGNIGGIIGNVFRALPGYAAILLNIADGFTHIVEAITGSGLVQGILQAGLALHGFAVYAGLAATAGAWLIKSALSGLATMALNGAVQLTKLGTAGGVAAEGLLKFGGLAESAAALPWGWILAAAAGFGVLVYNLVTAKTAAQQFNDSMMKMLQNAPLQQFNATYAAAWAQTSTNLAKATAQLHDAMTNVTHDTIVFAGRAGGFNETLMQAQSNVAGFKQGLTQLSDTYNLVNARVGALAGQYGGMTAATALLNAAGITTQQIMTTNNATWQQAKVEIQATADAMNAMSFGSGQNAAAMTALGGDYMTNVLPAIQKVTNAEDTLLGVITGGEGAFTTWMQNLNQISTDAQASGASIGGLNSQSLTLASDYYNTLIPSTQSMIDKLVQQGASGKTLTGIVATAAAQLATYAGNNTAAENAIVGLINNALGPGTVSLQTLNTWIGNNSGSLTGMQGTVGTLTGKVLGLTGALNSIPKNIDSYVNVHYATYYATYGLPPGSSPGTGGTGHAFGGITTAAAMGGPRGGLVKVGEHGAELVQLPSGSHVIPNGNQAAQVAAGMGAGAIEIVLSIDQSFQKLGLSQDQLEAIRYEVRTKGGGNVQKALGKN